VAVDNVHQTASSGSAELETIDAGGSEAGDDGVQWAHGVSHNRHSAMRLAFNFHHATTYCASPLLFAEIKFEFAQHHASSITACVGTVVRVIVP